MNKPAWLQELVINVPDRWDFKQAWDELKEIFWPFVQRKHTMEFIETVPDGLSGFNFLAYMGDPDAPEEMRETGYLYRCKTCQQEEMIDSLAHIMRHIFNRQIIWTGDEIQQ